MSPGSVLTIGKDEMNLVEYPFTRMGTKDRRTHFFYEWRNNSTGETRTWEVSSTDTRGMPTEYAERVYIALLALTAEQGFSSQVVSFSIYRALKIMRLTTSGRDLLNFAHALEQLKGLTIYCNNALWNPQEKVRKSSKSGFCILDEVKVRYVEQDDIIHEGESVAAVIKWSDTLWQYFQSGNIKTLDLDFYFNLERPLSRRMYRLLDKRFNRGRNPVFVRDLLDFALKLGMQIQMSSDTDQVKYRKPAYIRSKLKPALDELVATGFLAQYEFYREGKYPRIRCFQANPESSTEIEPVTLSYAEDYAAQQTEQLHVLYGTTQPELDVWTQVLGDLQNQMTKNTFETHFSQSKLVTLQDETAIIVVPNSLSADWVKNRLANFNEISWYTRFFVGRSHD